MQPGSASAKFRQMDGVKPDKHSQVQDGDSSVVIPFLTSLPLTCSFPPFHTHCRESQREQSLVSPPEGISTSSQLPFILPWPRAEKNATLLLKDFLHAVWDAAPISLGDSRCCTGLLLSLPKPYDIQGAVKPS